MRLRITTPLSIVIDEDAIQVLSAEDASGGFGIQPGHANFLTSLAIAVVRWQSADGLRHDCAVRGGVMTVTGGREIAIATREAVPGDGTTPLDQTILQHFRADIEAERSDRADATRLQLDAIRQIVRHLRPSGADHGLLS